MAIPRLFHSVARMHERQRSSSLEVGTPARKLDARLSLPVALGLLSAGALLSAAALAAYVRHGARIGANELMHPAPTEPTQTLESFGLPGETVTIPSGDHQLKAWFVPAERETDLAVALFHGHSSARSQLLPYARFLRRDYHCLLVDFRACGESEGPCSSMGVLEADDVRAAVRYLKDRGCARVGGWGMSMGGAALLRAAADTPAIEAVVTEGTFDRVRHVAAKRLKDRGYPLPRLLAGAIVEAVSRELGVALEADEPAEVIGRISPRPVLVIHGSEDATSEVANGHRLYRAGGYPKELFVVQGAGHTRCYQVAPGEYERRVLAFYQRYLQGARPLA